MENSFARGYQCHARQCPSLNPSYHKKQSHLFRRNRLVRLVRRRFQVKHASLLQLWVEAQWFCAACCLKCCLKLPLHSPCHLLHSFSLGRARCCGVHGLLLRIYRQENDRGMWNYYMGSSAHGKCSVSLQSVSDITGVRRGNGRLDFCLSKFLPH